MNETAGDIKKWTAMYEASLEERTFRIEVVDDESKLSSIIDEVFKLLAAAYGGNFLTARSSRELLKKTDLAKIAVDSNRTIIACSLYREDLGGKKMTSIGALKDDSLGKEALQAIIKDDIAPYDGWYWAEVSGAIEHYFKKFDGNPIPNTFAAIFLEKDPAALKLEEDGVHYTREIGVDHLPFSKMIYGFKTRELADQVMKSIQDYEDFKIEVNKLEEKLFGRSASEEARRLKVACMTISAVYDLEVEHDVHEMLPVWLDKLHRALKAIERSAVIDPELNKRAKACYKRGKLLLETMPTLEIKQFHLKLK